MYYVVGLQATLINPVSPLLYLSILTTATLFITNGRCQQTRLHPNEVWLRVHTMSDVRRYAYFWMLDTGTASQRHLSSRNSLG
jgi:hypothetical protein